MTDDSFTELRTRIRRTGVLNLQLAKLVGIQKTHLSAILRGKRKCSVTYLRRIVLAIEFCEKIALLSRLPIDFCAPEVPLLWMRYKREHDNFDLQAPAPRAAEQTASHFTAA
jgi:hypothetical protein